jgi:hypothetical protein
MRGVVAARSVDLAVDFLLAGSIQGCGTGIDQVEDPAASSFACKVGERSLR